MGNVGSLQLAYTRFTISSYTVIDTTQNINYFQAFCLGIGQVMFQGNTILSGLCFLIGILINSRKASLYTILGALLPIPLAILLEVDATDLNAGLMGYNGVLCAIALGGTSWKSGVWQGALSYCPPYYRF